MLRLICHQPWGTGTICFGKVHSIPTIVDSEHSLFLDKSTLERLVSPIHNPSPQIFQSCASPMYLEENSSNHNTMTNYFQLQEVIHNIHLMKNK